MPFNIDFNLEGKTQPEPLEVKKIKMSSQGTLTVSFSKPILPIAFNQAKRRLQ